MSKREEQFFQQALATFRDISMMLGLNLVSSMFLINTMRELVTTIKDIKIDMPKEFTVKEKLDDLYKVVICYLNEAHEDEEYSLQDKKFQSLTLVRADSDFDFRVNSKGNDITPVKAGQTFTLQMEVTKLYISNFAASGIAVFFLTRRVE